MFDSKKISGMAVLAAMGVALSLIVHLPLIPSAPYLEYDPADIPIYIGTFMYGPFAGIILTLVVSVIQGTTVSASSGWIGIVMHFFATGSCALVAGVIYKYNRTIKGAILGLLGGSIVMILAMIGLNIIFLPMFTGMPRQAVFGMILPVILPFNALKAVINSLTTMLLYKRVSHLFKYVYEQKYKKNNRH